VSRESGLSLARRQIYTAGLLQFVPPSAWRLFARRSCEISMAKSKKKAETVFLVCEETGDHNYVLTRKPGGEKLKLKKYCPRLRKHTIHVEKKK
jgi:large subunit ribosomal protein L33